MYMFIVAHSNGNWDSSDFCLLESMTIYKYITDIPDRISYYNLRGEKIAQIFQQPDITTTSTGDVSTTTGTFVRNIRKLPNKIKKLMELLPHQEARLTYLSLSLSCSLI